MASTIAALSAILFLCFTGIRSQNAKECLINLATDFNPSNPPMIISLTEPPSYVYPTTKHSSEIVLKKGEELRIACPKKSNRASTKSTADGILQWREQNLSPERGAEQITCLGNNLFDLNDKEVKFAEVSCEEKARASYSPILRETETTCLTGNRHEIGYALDDDLFLRTLELCHDKDEDRTLWAHDVIQPVNTRSNRFKSDGRASFKTGSLYSDIKMSKDNPYNLTNAFENLATILNSEKKASKYLSPVLSERKFFAKGHLIADADKIYKSEKDSTYFYANTVPMWQQINAMPGNWFFVEEYVRKLAVQRGHELDIWVGGVGVAELEGQKIYLLNKPVAGRKQVARKIPVPNMLFKCAVDRTDGQAACFLVVNNPYADKSEIEDPEGIYNACTQRSDICDGLTKNHDDVELGYLYCCDLKDFVKKSQEELGLEDLQEFLEYETMELSPL